MTKQKNPVRKSQTGEPTKNGGEFGSKSNSAPEASLPSTGRYKLLMGNLGAAARILLAARSAHAQAALDLLRARLLDRYPTATSAVFHSADWNDDRASLDHICDSDGQVLFDANKDPLSVHRMIADDLICELGDDIGEYLDGTETYDGEQFELDLTVQKDIREFDPGEALGLRGVLGDRVIAHNSH